MSQSLCLLCFSWVFLGNAVISARGSGESSDASPCCIAISFAGSSAGASSLDGLNSRIGIKWDKQSMYNPCNLPETNLQGSFGEIFLAKVPDHILIRQVEPCGRHVLCPDYRDVR